MKRNGDFVNSEFLDLWVVPRKTPQQFGFEKGIKMKNIIVIAFSLLMAIILAACQSSTLVPPTETALPTKTVTQTITLTPTQTITPSPTQTIIPSLTPTPQPTSTPMPPQINEGVIYYDWGSENDSSPYLVWGAQLRDQMNGNCQGFICGGKDLREYDADVWQFLGRGEYGKMVFTFDKPVDTFVINYYGRMGFDALSGKTVDGKTVTYGYLDNGKVSASYMDTSDFSMKTIGDAEDNHRPVTKPCGIIDLNPDGDNNFNLSEGTGGIVWNFLDHPWGPTVYSTRKGYSLISLTIISQSINKITSDQICP